MKILRVNEKSDVDDTVIERATRKIMEFHIFFRPEDVNFFFTSFLFVLRFTQITNIPVGEIDF